MDQQLSASTTRRNVDPTNQARQEEALSPEHQELVQQKIEQDRQAANQIDNTESVDALAGDNASTQIEADVQALEITSERAKVRRNRSLRALNLICEPNALIITRILFSTQDASLTSILTADRCSEEGTVEVEVIQQEANFNPDADNLSVKVAQSTDGTAQGSISRGIELS